MWPFGFLNDWNKPAPPPPPKEKINVRRAIVTIDALIEDDHGDKTSKQWKLYFDGRTGWIDLDASHFFQRWKNDGSCGLLHVGNREYIPLCKVASVNVLYEDLWMEESDE